MGKNKYRHNSQQAIKANPTKNHQTLKPESQNTFYIKQESIWIGISLIIGYFYACYILGFGFVNNITNTSYLSDDMLQHFLGWALYRSDQWYWPLTLTQKIQYPNFTSIVYTDSFPLLSIILKVFSNILPTIFIWHGIVAIFNCSLQFYFGCLIFRSLRKDTLFAIIGGIFLLFSSALTWRFFKHYSLTSHWLILASIYLIIKPYNKQYIIRDFILYLTLIFIALGTHAYIFMMLFIFSFAFFYRNYCVDHLNGYKIALRIILIMLISFISYYFFGYFTLNGSIAMGGFGIFSFNLDSLINSMNFSTFIHPLPLLYMQNLESFQYLGLGIILALLIALYKVFKNLNGSKVKSFIQSQYFALFILSILMLLISLSSRITCGSNLIVDLSSYLDNTYVQMITGTFRSSARMFWPVFYLILIFAIIKCYDFFSYKSKKVANIAMLILLCIQIIDLYPLHLAISQMTKTNVKRNSWNYDLKDPFWYHLNTYQHMSLFMNPQQDTNGYPAYFKFGMIAVINNLTMDTFYMARGNNTQQLYAEMGDFAQGNLDSNTIYVLASEILQQMNPQLLYLINCKNIDGYTVCQKR